MLKNLLSSPELEIVHLAGPTPKSGACQRNVVLIHGIDGDHLSTWSKNPEDRSWLNDLTSADPGLSISTVSIPYSNLKWISSKEKYLEQFSAPLVEGLLSSCVLDNPTMFLCHSLGGLLLKRTLVDALSHQDGQRLGIRKGNWKKIVFLGVPHKGSPFAKTLIAKLLLLARSETSRDLKPGKRFLEALDASFAQSVGRYPFCTVHSFHETKPIWQDQRIFLLGPLVRWYTRRCGPVVPSDYSHLENVDSTNVFIDACHFMVCKLDIQTTKPVLELVGEFSDTSASSEAGKLGLFPS